MDRGGSRGGKLGVQLGLLLQTLDLRAQVLDLDGKTEDGSVPYNILLKQLECMR